MCGFESVVGNCASFRLAICLSPHSDSILSNFLARPQVYNCGHGLIRIYFLQLRNKYQIKHFEYDGGVASALLVDDVKLRSPITFSCKANEVEKIGKLKIISGKNDCWFF